MGFLDSEIVLSGFQKSHGKQTVPKIKLDFIKLLKFGDLPL